MSLLNNKVRDTIFYFVEFFRYLPVPVFIPITILWFGIEDMERYPGTKVFAEDWNNTRI